MQTVGMRQLVNSGGNTLPIHFYVIPTLSPLKQKSKSQATGLAMSRKRSGATSRYRRNQAAPLVGSIAALGDARKPSAHSGSRSMIAKKQTITVNVFDHETPETITASVRQGH